MAREASRVADISDVASVKIVSDVQCHGCGIRLLTLSVQVAEVVTAELQISDQGCVVIANVNKLSFTPARCGLQLYAVLPESSCLHSTMD